MASGVTDIPASKRDSEGKPKDSELYRQIAKEDEEPPIIVKKDHKSPIMNLVIGFMRATLYVDSLRRTNGLFFEQLGKLWAFFMGMLYLSGLLMLGFSVYNRLQLPYYLENQLKARNIQFESAHYDMNRIEVRQLKGPDGRYTIDTLIVNTTFSDLLQRRIRSVILDGVNIYLGDHTDFNPVQDIPAILTQLQHPAQGEVDLTINALTVNNAKLNFEKGQMALPLSFSMEGIYDDTTQIVIPVSFEKPALRFQGALTISDNEGQPEWVLKITKGNVTLPRRAPENFVGEIKVVLSEQKLDSAFVEFHLGEGTIQKEIRVNIQKDDNEELAGTFSWQRINSTEPSLSSDLTIQMPHVEFSDKELLRTKGPLTVDSKQFNLYNISFKNLHTDVDAEIVCQSWKQCAVNILEKSEVAVPEFQFEYQKKKFKTNDALKFLLLAQDHFILMDATKSDFYLNFNLALQNVAFNGENTVSGKKIETTSEKISVNAVWAGESRMAIALNGLNYDGAMVSFKKASLDISDILQPTSQIKMRTQEMRLIDQPLLSLPFELNFNMVGNQIAARLKVKDQPILMGLEGALSLSQQTFSGKMTIAPFDLKDVTIPLTELWPTLPSKLQNAQGMVAANGLLNWSGGHASGNPIFIGFKDVDFDLGATKIRGLNTVLAVESLMPLTTKKNQHIFVQDIQSLLPIQDLDAQFQLDNQSLKINQLQAAVASIPLMMPASVISVKNNGLMLYLKNSHPIDLNQMQKSLNLHGVAISSGSASVSIPIEVKEGEFDIPNVIAKVQDAQLKWQVPPAKVFGESTGYLIRDGQFIWNQDMFARIALNGRLVPSRMAKEVQLEHIPVPADLIAPVPTRGIPRDILGWQKKLFGTVSP